MRMTAVPGARGWRGVILWGAENACYLGVCAEEAIGLVPARGGWWRVCNRAAVR